MIRFVDFKLALGDVIIESDVIEDEAGWEKGQIELKTGIIKRFTTSRSSEYLAYEAIKKIKNNEWMKNVDSIISITTLPVLFFQIFLIMRIHF